MNLAKEISHHFKHLMPGIHPDRITPSCFDFTGTIFIHIPKNAGQSIGTALYGQTIHHRKACFYKHYYRQQFDKAFVFATVRNPVERFLSAFRYMQMGGRSKKDRKIFDKYLANQSIDGFLDYLENTDFDKISDLFHFHTQTSFLCETHDPHAIIVDRVYKLDQLHILLRDFSKNACQPPISSTFAKTNISEGANITLSPKQQKQVMNIYNIDYANFF